MEDSGVVSTANVVSLDSDVAHFWTLDFLEGEHL